MPEESQGTDNGGGEDAQAQQMLSDATRMFGQDDVERIVGNRLARERAKFADYDDLKKKATEFDKVAEAQKTEAQKAADRATAAEQRATQAELAQTKLDVAFENAPDGMPPKQVRQLAKRLTGSSREELQTDAAELFAELPQAAPGNGARRPVETLRSGSAAAGGDAPGDMNEWMRGRTARR